MNKYPINVEFTEKTDSIGLALAAIDDGEVVQLRYIDDVLNFEVIDPPDDSGGNLNKSLDKFYRHKKTQEVLFELSNSGEACFGVVVKGYFVEL